MSHLKTKALTAMRRIARASTVEEFEEKVQLLKDDEELWGQSLFSKWFEKTWLRQHKVSPFSVKFPLPFLNISLPSLTRIQYFTSNRISPENFPDQD